MTLDEYINATRNNKFKLSADPKEQLWQAVYKGDYPKFKEVIDTNNSMAQGINEYRFGITLLHLLVYHDQTHHYTTKEAINGRQQIAKALLELGADLNAAAKESTFGINIGETPWQMAYKCDNWPWYYHTGIRASFIYTGEHVMPVFKEHLGIKETPSMLTQFSNAYVNNATPILAALTATTLAFAAVKCYEVKLKPKP